MKKLYKILFIIICFFVINTLEVYAYDKYNMEDFAYYDPIENKKCSEKDYWTLYNQNTTCYRFVVLSPDDTTSKSTIKLLLDHDLGTSTYNNYQAVLYDKTTDWKIAVDIPDEETIATAMRININDFDITNLNKLSLNYGGNPMYMLSTNTKYMIDGIEINHAGYWVKGDYEGSSTYAYSITEGGNNRLVKKTVTRGVRPMITVDKELLTKSNLIENKTTTLENSNEYKYNKVDANEFNIYVELSDGTIKHITQYSQSQGFTLTNSNLAFYTTHSQNSGKGIIMVYNGNNHNTLNKKIYTDGDNIPANGHGNSMTFNSTTNKILIPSTVYDENNSTYNIYQYHGDTIDYEKKYNVDSGYSSLSYDYKNDYYLAQASKRVYLTDTTDNFNRKYSFDVPTLLGGQDAEYKNGYLYYTAVDWGNNTDQLYTFDEAYSARIYVYNAKLKQDKTPDNDFGRLDKIIYVGNIPRTTNPSKLNTPGTGEIEGISFQGDKVILGYATQNFDSTNTFKFYEFDYSKIKSDLNLKTHYSNEDPNGNFIKVIIKSTTQLSQLEGWSLSNDKYSLSKIYSKDTEPFNVSVCDNYNNCTTTQIDLSNERTGFKKIDNGLYYYDENNVMQTGWKKLNNIWYYFRKSANDISIGPKGMAVVGLATIQSNNIDYKYYFRTAENDISEGPAASMIKGIATINNNTYYFRKSANEVKYGPEGSALADACVKDNNSYYCFDLAGYLISKKDYAEIPDNTMCNNITYNGSKQTLTKEALEGYTWSNNKNINAGTYQVIAKLSDGYIWNDNSTIDKEITCEISKATWSNPTVTSYSGTYDGNPHTIEANGSSTLEYSINGTVWIEEKPTRTDIGTTTVYVRVKEDNNHNVSETVSGTITIIKSTEGYTINNYDVDEVNSYINKIMVNTELSDFTSNITLGYGYGVDVDTKTVNNKELLYTGGKTRITKNSDLYKEYTNIVVGDVNGDAGINSADLLKIRQHLLGINTLKGAYFISSDVNYDKSVNSADLLRVRQHLLGTKIIGS